MISSITWWDRQLLRDLQNSIHASGSERSAKVYWLFVGRGFSPASLGFSKLRRAEARLRARVNHLRNSAREVNYFGKLPKQTVCWMRRSLQEELEQFGERQFGPQMKADS